MAWEQLLDIRRTAALEAEAERRRPLEACPNCGEPLNRFRGVLDCPNGDFRVGGR